MMPRPPPIQELAYNDWAGQLYSYSPSTTMMRPNILLYTCHCCCNACCASRSLLHHTVHPNAYLAHRLCQETLAVQYKETEVEALRSAAESACYSRAAGDSQSFRSNPAHTSSVHSCCLLIAARTTPWKFETTTNRLWK